MSLHDTRPHAATPPLARFAPWMAGWSLRFARQVEVVAAASGLPRTRLLRWVAAYAGLSAAWFHEEADAASAVSDLTVARFALTALDVRVP